MEGYVLSSQKHARLSKLIPCREKSPGRSEKINGFYPNNRQVSRINDQGFQEIVIDSVRIFGNTVTLEIWYKGK